MKKDGHRIAILSDTHSLLRPEAAAVMKSCELVFHLGDIADQKTFDAVSQVGEAVFVRGNADKEWAQGIPETQDVVRFGFRFFMIHNKGKMDIDPAEYDFVLFGHSHKYTEMEKGGTVFLNPGSMGPVRFGKPVTMMVLTLYEGDHTFEVEKVEVGNAPPVKDAGEIKRDMAEIVSRVVRDMKKGRKAAEIAAKNGIPQELVNQILQIYTTHPGIDMDGILNRMEIWGK